MPDFLQKIAEFFRNLYIAKEKRYDPTFCFGRLKTYFFLYVLYTNYTFKPNKKRLRAFFAKLDKIVWECTNPNKIKILASLHAKRYLHLFFHTM